MAEFRRIKVSLFLILGLQFTAAATRQLLLSYTVRVGDEVTLSCENVKDDQDNCDGTTWLFTESRGKTAVELVKLGQIGENAKTKSDRLSVTANCSLVIKKVTVEDVGRYDCQQYKKSAGKESPDTVVYLSLITMTEQKDTDKVTLSCSVLTYRQCGHTVKWLFRGQDVDKNNKDMKTSQSPCSASVNFLTSHYIYTSRYDLLKCEVTDGNTGKVQLFPFRLRPSGEEPGEDSITETKLTTTENSKKTGTTTTASATTDASTELRDMWWLYILVAVVLVALLIIVVKVIRWKRTKGNKTCMSDNVADPEDGVSYASISYTKKTNCKARVQCKNDDDEGDAVTYMTVKASSADPSNLYATISHI